MASPCLQRDVIGRNVFNGSSHSLDDKQLCLDGKLTQGQIKKWISVEPKCVLI